MKLEKFAYDVRKATLEDIPAIVDTALVFWHTSGHGQNDSQSPEKFAEFVKGYIDADGYRVIVAVIPNGQVVGYFMIYAHMDYKTKPDGETALYGGLYQFFVHPHYRGTGVARALAEMGIQTFDDWGCDVSYVIGSGEVGDTELVQFRNLFAKFGYIETGIVMTRRDGNHGRTETIRADAGTTRRSS